MNVLRVLVACEESQAVCKEFRRLGHDAYSCDVQECSGGHPEWHIQGDVLPLLRQQWDLVVAFPPCTHLAVSGARHFAKKRADGRQQQGIDFFMQFAELKVPYAIENPIGIMSSMWRKPNQIIQPWHFGDHALKSTCLWLQGIPSLVHEVSEKPQFEYWEKKDEKTGKVRRQEMWYYKTRCLSGDAKAKAASKTFPGIARAMAEQWSAFLCDAPDMPLFNKESDNA